MPDDDQTTTTHRNRAYQALLAVLGDRPIAYHASLAKATKSVTAGILLSQLVYWSQRGRDPEGWIWKTQGEIYEETALGRREQETARRALVHLKVLEEKRRGVPAKMHFRVDMEALVNLLSSYQDPQDTVAKINGSPRPGGAGEPRGDAHPGGTRQSSMAESANLVGRNVPDQTVQNRLTISETTTETTSQNNNTVGVVSELAECGLTSAVARRLAEAFPQEYILEKIDLVRWLKENRPRVVGQNPAGFLRKAIQEDYQPPPAYKTPAERQAEAAQQQQKQAARLRELELAQQELKRQEQEELRRKELARKALAREYPPQEIPGTEFTTETAWQRALALLEQGMTAANFQTWLKDTQLVSCDERTATIVAPSPFVVDWLRQRFYPLIEKELADVLGYRVETRFLALTELDGHATRKGQPAASPAQGSTLGRE